MGILEFNLSRDEDGGGSTIMGMTGSSARATVVSKFVESLTSLTHSHIFQFSLLEATALSLFFISTSPLLHKYISRQPLCYITNSFLSPLLSLLTSLAAALLSSKYQVGFFLKSVCVARRTWFNDDKDPASCHAVRSVAAVLLEQLMEDCFNRICNLASELGYRFFQFFEDAFGYFYESNPYDYGSFFGEYSSSNNDSSASLQDWILSCSQNVLLLFIKKSLLAPSYGVKLGCIIVTRCFNYCRLYVTEAQEKIQVLVYRLQRTLEGSTADIGWLQKTEGLPSVVDGTTQFKEILHNVRHGMHILPDTLIYLFIPGLFSNHSPLYFVNTKRFFSKMGLTCHIAKIHSEASTEKNAWELKHYIEELYWGSGKRILLLGHSKGGIDAAAALSLYWSDLRDKVAGLALVQSPYGGSPIASDILREGQIADKEARRIMEFIVCKLIKGDMRALDDLTYDKRKDFISKHSLPSDELPIVSFHTEASSAPGVLATMSHIAHAELPWLPLPQFLTQYDDSYSTAKIPVVIPLSAAMAVSALHLRLRYGERSDGLVARCDAEVPGSVVVRLDRKLDHAWMVYSTLKKDPVEADASEMCEALLTMLVEIAKEKCGNFL